MSPVFLKRMTCKSLINHLFFEFCRNKEIAKTERKASKAGFIGVLRSKY